MATTVTENIEEPNLILDASSFKATQEELVEISIFRTRTRMKKQVMIRKALVAYARANGEPLGEYLSVEEGKQLREYLDKSGRNYGAWLRLLVLGAMAADATPVTTSPEASAGDGSPQDEAVSLPLHGDGEASES